MKILIICSKAFYGKIPSIKAELEKAGHEIELPNCFDCPETEDGLRGTEKHSEFKAAMFKKSRATIAEMDAVLILNFDKDGVKNYIGGATFLEAYDAFCLNKKIYLFNDIPEGILKDELIGFSPVVIKGDLSKVC